MLHSNGSIVRAPKINPKKLAQKHLTEGHLVLYDITSSYLEGEYEKSEIVDYGYNRDGKKGHAQIVIGLICDKEGCPVGVEVYRGNTKDSTTALDKIDEIRQIYGIKEVTFVGDRGMLTKHNLEEIQKKQNENELLKNHFNFITALTHHDIRNLVKRDVIQPELFDEKNICEVTDPEETEKRYCLCRNPLRAKKDGDTRARLIELTESELTKIAHYKQSTTVEVLGARIGKVLDKYKTGKYITWEVKPDSSLKSKDHQVIWHQNTEKLEQEAQLDGCYVITTTASIESLTTEQTVASYKNLMMVEKAFRNLKTVQLEIRPIYHKTDDRIRSHAFLCMLAYYVQWHMQKRIESLTQRQKEGKKRRWTFCHIIETLKQITQNKVKIEGTEFYQISQLTSDQQKIYDLMAVKI